MKQLYTLVIAVFLFHASGHAQSWEPLGTGTNALKVNGEIYSLCYDNGTIYAGGHFTDSAGNSYVPKWNGASWEQLGGSSKPLNGETIAGSVCVDKEHNVYTLRMQKESKKSHVVMWDGAQWNELGTGSNALDTSYGVWAICAGNDGNIYASAIVNYTDITCNVFRWDGTAWSQLGAGSNALNSKGFITTLAADSHGNIYAAGEFKQSGYVYVARWDGTGWSSVGAGDNPLNVTFSGDGIRTLYIDKDDNIYAGGAFANKDGVYVAKWDGTEWTALGRGNKSVVEHRYATVYTITGDKAGNIYATGYGFRQPTWKHCVKKWNGTDWDEAGIGGSSISTDQPVKAMCADSAGNLYAGGYYYKNNAGYSQVVKFSASAATTPVSPAQRINAWPIPADERLFIEVNTFGAYYYVYNMQGVLMDVMQNDKTGRGTNFIYVNNLPRGTYILKTDNAEACVFIKN